MPTQHKITLFRVVFGFSIFLVGLVTTLTAQAWANEAKIGKPPVPYMWKYVPLYVHAVGICGVGLTVAGLLAIGGKKE